MEKKKREYLGIYCRYQTALEDHWIAELEKEISDEALDAIKKKAIKEKDDTAQSLPETLSALRHRARAIYKKKRDERAIEIMEKYLFTNNISESYIEAPPSKADCETFSVEETERQQKESREQAEQQQKEAQVQAERRQKAAQEEAQQRQAKVEKILALSTMVMVDVPGGSFAMGCTPEQKNCEDDEKPAHQVQVNVFQIGKYEVTLELWMAVMRGTRYLGGSGDCARCPVTKVSWNDVQAFLEKLNGLTGERYRLPTEAEWEYAARGGQQSKGYEYVGSNEPDSVAWYNGNSGSKKYPNDSGSKPVGQKRLNELGLYDMSGNVREWVQDCWNKTYVGAPNDGNAWDQGNCDYHVLRGGSWNDAPSNLRAANRNGGGYNTNTIGFRLARTLP